MNTNEVLGTMALLVLIIIRLILYDLRYFYYTIVSLFLFALLRLFALLSYDKWLDRQIINNQVEKIINECLVDVDDITTLTSTDVSNEEFPNDNKRKENNNKLIEKSSIVISSFLVLSLICLYFIDNKFYKDFYKIILSIGVILGAEFYFSYSISSNIENDTIKGVRQKILDKIIKS